SDGIGGQRSTRAGRRRRRVDAPGWTGAGVRRQDSRRRHRGVTLGRDTGRVSDRGERETDRRADRSLENGRAGRRRVLVAEDEQDVAELIRYHLAKDGYDPVLAKTGREALEQVRCAQPDLILLDIMIPEMNGWEVCRCLKRDPATADIPVIMVTGRVEEGDKILGLEMGADDYVSKPFSPRELLARIRAVARGRTGETGKRRHIKVGGLEIDRERFEVTS